MKPAPSIIAFTISSGLGYGMLFLLALGASSGLIPADRWLGLTGLALALAFITGGLISSTFHLGHPERAMLALTQWRSSWLSREALAAALTYLPTLIFGFGWVILQDVTGIFMIMALMAALGAVATVYCTGMIYASLPPIPAWHHPLTAPIYLGFALMTGALGVHLLLAVFSMPTYWAGSLALVATAAVFGLKIFYWWKSSKQKPTVSIESATGLGQFGRVQALDQPHMETSYLFDEMGFAIGRKHARRVRVLSVLLGLFGPLMLTLLALVFDGWLRPFFACLALVFGMTGVLLERWLFFAEAEHTAMLYYGGAMEGKEAVKEQPKWQQSAQATRSRSSPQRRPVKASIAGGRQQR